MLNAIRSGEDLHWKTARALWGPDATDKHRKHAKVVNFGIFYGMGPMHLANEIGVSMRDAQRILRTWFETYPGVQAWLARQHETLLSQGWVKSLTSRRRRLPAVMMMGQEEQSRMLRQAGNFGVQSLGADITAFAMAKLSSMGMAVIGNVHDSILLDLTKDGVEEEVKIIRNVMEHPVGIVPNLPELSVPLVVEVKAGRNWMDLEEI